MDIPTPKSVSYDKAPHAAFIDEDGFPTVIDEENSEKVVFLTDKGEEILANTSSYDELEEMDFDDNEDDVTCFADMVTHEVELHELIKLYRHVAENHPHILEEMNK